MPTAWGIDLLRLFAGSRSGALAPAPIFWVLELTTVNTVILLGRIEPPLVLAAIVLQERVHPLVAAGAGLSFGGVVLTVLLQPASTPV
ncbi:hypothetical protein [Synechococcus sp. PCC 7336]|uniref:hypothetical protein n=1 Tax=Synechococcus sp. PCC 7336 TaxID=195250 RepID=UPI000346DBF5|nr:hypothetical protein [Synechococcus sp. PCC 7336]